VDARSLKLFIRELEQIQNRADYNVHNYSTIKWYMVQ